MQIIRRHQQLQTQLRRYLHVRHVLLILMLQVVVQVLADFFQHDPARNTCQRDMTLLPIVVCAGDGKNLRRGKMRERTLSSPTCTGPKSTPRTNLSHSLFVIIIVLFIHSFSSFMFLSICWPSSAAVGFETRHVLCGSNIFFIVPATLAASRLTMNSKPSLEMRVM